MRAHGLGQYRRNDIEYAGGIEMAPNNFVHAIRKLPVRFTPQRSI
jgi:hypothetical protein